MMRSISSENRFPSKGQAIENHGLGNELSSPRHSQCMTPPHLGIGSNVGKSADLGAHNSRPYRNPVVAP